MARRTRGPTFLALRPELAVYFSRCQERDLPAGGWEVMRLEGNTQPRALRAKSWPTQSTR
ncbi:hypothetical protein [Nitrosococcus oceani]|uniref:hypothetical protein n=1 Tax=Nitrosococcus oceani TaxID=1229 RepID=UPI0018CE6ADB|nr:hypothetical protein [Nitrosococcus oceani]